MDSTKNQDVIVIGAGIIGISIALKLQSEGRQVLVLDRKGVAAETSAGNAGAFAFADVIPLATPGIMRKAPKWLIDPLGPLSLRPAYALKILPWMLRFWRASWQDKYQAALAAQASLMAVSKAALERQIDAVGGEAMIRREGQLQLYEGEAEFSASLAGWQTRQAHGVVYEFLLSSEAIAKIQPGIHPRFTHAAFTPEWINVCDPAQWTQHLANEFEKRGGKIAIAAIHSISIQQDSVILKSDSADYEANQVVLCAGAWSKTLAQSIGDSLPLDTERGYNTTLPSGAFDLKTHVTFSNHGFVVTKIGEGVRVGGAVELGGLDLQPNFQRAEVLLDKAKTFLPSLKIEDGKQWMGFRPSMPDSLPVISYASRSKRVIYAFGHGHLGLTQSAGTAELVAALVSNGTPDIDLTPFSANRF
ncbi:MULTISPECIES: NAD(P)/FAD-dependent oxidoreductase [Marinomonas]|uniref:FAD-dependent oxidoreductase n=1 Tax=Marinomonas arctica TaxID=383750 RepID=A0A7H1J6M0_9GAMM|nr:MULTISPECIES: FAD-dependent oxidoreductase [Marinomonas]MCS7485212.1 amino acid dehydrogenase [Marinomonas sp. BSi20414]QNT06136.1 FAD-dependent oxidoreductase [Marinomonas arctica]